MPLRLTAPTPSATRPTDESLAPRAAELVAGGELADFRELAARSAADPDPQRRYTGALALLEGGLIGAGRVPSARRARALATIVEVAITALEAQPAEPLLLHHAGVACHELWMLDASSALLRAARRLDSGIPQLAGNLSALERRRRGPRPARPLHPSVSALTRRAAAVARRAEPAQGRTISLCMIVRDEAAMLGRCLASVTGGVDEIVVVDTGSRDATREIAASFGARVIDFPWTGSFAQARNVSLDAATGDWVLFLDGDEVLADGDAERLREYAGHDWREALFLTETSFTGELGDGTAITHLALRMFRNRPEYRFTGDIHEQIAPALPTAVPGRIGMSALRLDHYGYLGDVKASKEKSDRNLELLRRQEAELGASPFLHYNMGTEYGSAGDFGAAVSHLTTAWAMLEREATLATAEYGPLLISGLVRALRATGRPDDADARARAGLELHPDFTDLVWEQGTTALGRGDVDRARALFERCLTMGDAPARHGGHAGTGSHFARAMLATIALDHDDDPARALELLEWCLVHRPSFLGATGPYATAALATGAEPAAVLDRLVEAYGPLPPVARHAAAGALRRAGRLEPAAREYRAVAGGDGPAPLRGAAAAALAELMLGTGRFTEAAETAVTVPDGDGRAALACRIEVTARLADGLVPLAATALARASAVGLPAADQEMFEAWITPARGETPAPLPLAAVPLLATLLELMLGVPESGAADQLRTLLAGSALPVRDQHQLIAEAQLRHGHLAGAAAEWMAVCETAPDPPALFGLAQVAVHHDMPQDALTFATAALELEPSFGPARDLVDALSGRADRRVTPAVTPESRPADATSAEPVVAATSEPVVAATSEPVVGPVAVGVDG